MRPFWHPLSTLLLSDPRCFATPHVVRILLEAEGRVQLVYTGDGMWPTLRHGATLTVEPVGHTTLEPGAVVLVTLSGIPDLRRIATTTADGLTLLADAVPGPPIALPQESVLAMTRLPKQWFGPTTRILRRLRLDLREAWMTRPDFSSDPARSVLDKYDSQATFYGSAKGPDIDPGLLQRIVARVGTSGEILVVGSGTGRESFALARAGYRVRGVEFSKAMIDLARDAAVRLGLPVEFQTADIRQYRLPPRSLAAVLFTYDVYSFLPGRSARVALLNKLRTWLQPGGVVFLSARRLHSAYERAVLTLQWLRRGGGEWGDSHTRWIATDGTLCHSFVRVFAPAQLGAEIRAAGLRAEPWVAGHGTLVTRAADMI